MSKLILTLVFFCTILSAQVEQSGDKNGGYQYSFDIDLASYPTGVPEKTRLDVFIKVPYSNIQFVRTTQGFTGKYTITLTFYDEYKRGIVLERFWNEKIVAEEFSEAISNKNYNYGYRSFEFKPGKYFLRCEILDKDSKKSSVYQGFVTVAEYDTKVQLSDIIFIGGKIQGGDGPQYIPLVSNILTSNDSTLTFIYEVYSEEKGTVNVEYYIQNSKEETIYSEITDLNLNKGTTNFEHTIKNPGIILGTYSLIVKLRNIEWDIEDEISKPFYSRIFGFPASIVDLDEAVEQMTYIAGAEVIGQIKDEEDFNEKLKLFKKFWSSKDPSPESEENEILREYYRRINYANRNFENYFDGWRTDMGMIYVVLGPPNNVERHPFDLDSKPYEIWDYYDVNKRFVFIDQTGFGDYRLLNQQYGDWYRYRP